MKTHAATSRRSYYSLAIVFILAFLSPERCICETLSGQHPQEFRGTGTLDVQFKYLLFLPEGYGSQADKKWPLIMYLHGASRSGTDIEKVREPGFEIAGFC